MVPGRHLNIEKPNDLSWLGRGWTRLATDSLGYPYKHVWIQSKIQEKVFQGRGESGFIARDGMRILNSTRIDFERVCGTWACPESWPYLISAAWFRIRFLARRKKT
jgi:hypothetical protein